MPLAVGVPLMVNTPALKLPVTPVGKPLTPAPVAVPPTEYVIFVMAKALHLVCTFVPAADVSDIVPKTFTVIVPVAVAAVQLPPMVVTV